MGSFSHIFSVAKSDVGRKRTNNEDAVGVWPNSGLFCVADGMGGGDDGEIASAAIVRGMDSVAGALSPRNDRTLPRETVVGCVTKVINSASAWIYNRAVDHHLTGCGSTFVCICFDAGNPSVATALHAGDSRLYRIRAGNIEQLTKDHSAAEMFGVKAEQEINPMFRGMILRAVGIKQSVELEMTSVDVRENDVFILCSDGLYRMIDEAHIVELATADEDDAVATVSSLVDAANESGGIDNISVVLLQVGKLPSPIGVDESLPIPEIDEAILSGVLSYRDTSLSESGERIGGIDCCEASDEGVEVHSRGMGLNRFGQFWARIRKWVT